LDVVKERGEEEKRSGGERKSDLYFACGHCVKAAKVFASP
jgi:hypothetical protein